MKKYRIDIPLNISLPLIVEAENEEQAYYQAWHELEVIQKACLSGFEALKGLVEGFGKAEMFDKARIEEFVKEREDVSEEQGVVGYFQFRDVRSSSHYGDGSYYEGEHKDGKYHGQGTYYYADGDRYEGGFKDGKKNGHGVLYRTDGSKWYEGQWKDGEPEGEIDE